MSEIVGRLVQLVYRSFEMTEDEFREGIRLIVADSRQNYEQQIISLLRNEFKEDLTGSEWMRVCETLVKEGSGFLPRVNQFIRTVRSLGYGKKYYEKPESEDRGERISADEFWAVLKENAPKIYENLISKRNGAGSCR